MDQRTEKGLEKKGDCQETEWEGEEVWKEQ